MQIWDGHMKWSHTVERIKITANDANILPFRSTFCNTMSRQHSSVWAVFEYSKHTCPINAWTHCVLSSDRCAGFFSTVCFFLEQHRIGFAWAGSALEMLIQVTPLSDRQSAIGKTPPEHFARPIMPRAQKHPLETLETPSFQWATLIKLLFQCKI